MAEKITYAGGYKRLHQVTEDLAKLTGATVRCGKGLRTSPHPVGHLGLEGAVPTVAQH